MNYIEDSTWIKKASIKHKKFEDEVNGKTKFRTQTRKRKRRKGTWMGDEGCDAHENQSEEYDATLQT